MNNLVLCAISIIASMLVCALFTGLLIPYLKKHQLKQFVRDVGPKSHLSKTGTPSMGGIAIVACLVLMSVIMTLINRTFSIDIVVVLLVVILHAAMGFIDDYTKATEHKNDGLSAKKKLILQFAISLAFAIYAYLTSDALVYVPFYGQYLNFGIWYIPWIVFVMIAFSNSVNLTDGLDGLASGVTAFVSVALMLASSKLGNLDQPIVLSCLCGACLGFLWFNRHPAKLFMGDTGSMALGSTLAATCILMRLEVVLAIAGLVYVCEALSVIMQVTYFKLTHGKRIFKMSPIHHHFELCGMKEVNVVYMFWLCALVFSVIAIISVR